MKGLKVYTLGLVAISTGILANNTFRLIHSRLLKSNSIVTVNVHKPTYFGNTLLSSIHPSSMSNHSTIPSELSQAQGLQAAASGLSGPQQDDAKQAQAAAAQEEQMRRDLMATVLDTAARERRASFKHPYRNRKELDRLFSDPLLVLVSRISLVSPERSRQIEGILVRMAQSGQLRGRVSENQLIELLEQVRS